MMGSIRNRQTPNSSICLCTSVLSASVLSHQRIHARKVPAPVAGRACEHCAAILGAGDWKGGASIRPYPTAVTEPSLGKYASFGTFLEKST